MLDGGDAAILGTGGTAALGFVLGVVKRYVDPRIDSLKERLAKSEAECAELQKRCDELSSECAKQRAELREQMGVMVTGVHNRINDVEKQASELKGKITVMRDRPRTGEL